MAHPYAQPVRPAAPPPVIAEPGVPPGYAIENHSDGMQGWGITLILLGTAGKVVSLVGFFNAADPCDGRCHDVEGLGAYPWAIAAGAGGFVGLVGFTVGVPLLVIGSQDELVPVDGSQETARAPEIRVGPTSASVSFAF